MKNVVADVHAFHEATGTPSYLGGPLFPKQDRIDLRIKLIQEEVKETIDAINARDMVEVADGLGDIIYVVVGTALELGIPLEAVWDEIQRSNMAKVDPATGKVTKREDGKILKPEGWTPPNIKSIIGGE